MTNQTTSQAVLQRDDLTGLQQRRNRCKPQRLSRFLHGVQVHTRHSSYVLVANEAE